MSGVRDIAERAQTSIATVSHVLNKTRPVTQELKTRVLKAAEELNYQPNLLARSLKMNRTGIIGLLISDILNPFYTEVTRAIQMEARNQNYQIILSNTFEDRTAQTEQLNMLTQYQVDGIILAPALESGGGISSINKMSIPVVLINRRVEGSRWPCICVDNFHSARNATEHFINIGRSRIGLMLSLEGVSHNEDRIRGYCHALEAANISFDDELIRYGGLTPDTAEKEGLDLLESHKNLQAILCGSEATTVGVFRAAQKLNVSIPEELGIIGSGNHSWASIHTPPLSQITQPTHAMGMEAFSRILAMIHANDRGPDWNGFLGKQQCTYLPSKFNHGGSCGCI